MLVCVRFLLRLSLPLRGQPRAEPVADRNQHPGEPAQPLGLTAEVFMLQLLGAVTSPLCKPLQKCLGTAEHSVQGQAWLCRHRRLLLLHHHPVSLGASPCPPAKQPFSTHQKAAALLFFQAPEEAIGTEITRRYFPNRERLTVCIAGVFVLMTGTIRRPALAPGSSADTCFLP